MGFPSRLPIWAAVALVAMTGCGDDKGYTSLDAFYGASPDRGPSSSSGGSSGGSSSGGTSSGVSCGGLSTSALVAYLPLDGDVQVLGTSSLTASDSPSSTSFVSGRFGQALSGSSQLFLEATKSLSLSSWTACAWVRVSSGSNIGFLAVPGTTPLNSGVAERGLVPGCGTGGVAPYVSRGSSSCLVASSSPFAFGEWNFLCIVDDSSRVQIVVDGVTASSGGKSAPLSIASGGSIAIGGGPKGSNAIDEFSLWSRALSTNELKTLSSTKCSSGGEGSP